jgi:hypothetical protein
MFKLHFEHHSLIFHQLPLVFLDHGLTNLFAHKNNKTVSETLTHRRYQNLDSLVRQRYPLALHEPLGMFLFSLKCAEDSTYKRFLNAYGDGVYCKFMTVPSPLAEQKGVYCFCIAGKVVYVGRSRASFLRRINQGYGTIHPKNCYLDGQATNCHLNALIALEIDAVSCYVSPLGNDQQIDNWERQLICAYRPAWNIALT